MHTVKFKTGITCSVAAIVLMAVVLIPLHNESVSAKSKVPKSPPAGSSFKERLAFRKKEYQPALSSEQKDQLQSQCADAQSVLSNMNSVAGAKLTKYNDTYGDIDGVVLVNIGQLKIAGQPTFDLEHQENTLAGKISDFAALAKYYHQALDDSVVINCASDPVGFQALLDTVRGYHQAIIDQSNDIYNYTTNTVKPTLEGFISKVGS